MRPVLTVAEMNEVDRRAMLAVPHAELVARAGRRLAAAAFDLLGGRAYGRRVTVLAGKGSNGADGRVAAAWLAGRGAAVRVVDAAAPPDRLGGDLVVDAAYGTGFRGAYAPPDTGATPVLACDVPSGVDADTGAVGPGSRPLAAAATVTFGALKPGLLLGPGAALAGAVLVEPIGLDVAAAGRSWLVDDGDVDLVPARDRHDHKYRSGVLVVAGSRSMPGAARLVAEGALRSGAGYVRLLSPGRDPGAGLPVPEVVGVPGPDRGWEEDALRAAERMRALALGPGLGATASTARGVTAVLGGCDLPAVVDADGLHGLDPATTAGRAAPTVLTPHDGELARLTGRQPGPDRLGEARAAADLFACVVLLKGPTTVVAEPGGRVLLAAAGTPRLATAGTGDVLTGMVAAFLARGTGPLEAAALAAHVHGRAAGAGPVWGLSAGDLPRLVSAWLSSTGRT